MENGGGPEASAAIVHFDANRYFCVVLIGPPCTFSGAEGNTDFCFPTPTSFVSEFLLVVRFSFLRRITGLVGPKLHFQPLGKPILYFVTITA